MSSNGDILSGSSKPATGIELDLGPTHKQRIALAGRESAVSIHGYEVDIFSSIDSSEGPIGAGSSKVKISTITNQNWELPSHNGTIVASNSQYLVYVLEGRNGHVLRLIQQETNNRALLKGFVGAVLDVAFAHANSNLLACVDQGGNVYIWDLDKTQDVTKIQSDTLMVQIRHGDSVDSLPHRLVWSPFVPQEEEEEQDGCSMVVTHGTDVEVYDISVVFRNIVTGMMMPRDKLRNGVLTIANAHEKTISDISLSPDGAVLATTSEDGHLKFWEVNWEVPQSEKPKCLHDFDPHGGAPVSRLIFCDNHLSQDPAAEFWRFLITAANNNTEVKIWCTVTWKCLQTLHFHPPLDNQEKFQPHILLRLDLSASYLLATDAKRMALYILQFYQDAGLGDASVTSITEYILTQPILSFVVSGHTPLSQSDDVDSGDEGDEMASPTGMKDFDSRRNTALIKLHCIQSRSMQELLVKFEPPDTFGIPPFGEDLFGGSKKGTSEQPVSANLPHDMPLPLVDTSLGVSPSVPSPLQLPLSTPQFSSLPTDLMGLNTSFTSEVVTPPSTSLFHSLTSTIGSPKLLTPSEFTSPAKSKTEPLYSSSEQTTLFNLQPDKTPPPSEHQDLQQRSSPSAQLPFSSKPEQSPSPIQSSVTPPATLTSVSEFGGETRSELTSVSQRDDATGIELNTEVAANGLKNLLESQAMKLEDRAPVTKGADKDDTMEDIDGSLEGTPPRTKPAEQIQNADAETQEIRLDSEVDQEQEIKQSVETESVENKEETNGSANDFDASTGGEEGSSSVQQGIDSIFKMLKVEQPLNNEPEVSAVSFEQFTEMLSDKSKLQEQELALTSTEKSVPGAEPSEFVSLPPRSKGDSRSEEDNSEIVTAAGNQPTEYLELLKQNIPSSSVEDAPLISELGSSGEKSGKRKPSESDEWPDIGAPEMPKAFEQSEETNATVSEQTSQQQQEQINTDSDISTLILLPSDDTKLVMPSADVAPMEAGMLNITDTSLPAQQPEPEVEKEAQNEEEEEEEEEEEVRVCMESGVAKVDQTPEGGSKPRKRSKRGGRSKAKKQNASALPVLGVTDVLEEGPSDGEPIAPDHPLFASAKAVPERQSDNTALITQLSQLVYSQQQEIYQLREEQRSNFMAIQQLLQGLGTTLSESQRLTLSEFSKEQQQKLDKVLRDKQGMDKQRQDRLISSLSQTLTTAVNTKLEKLVKNEMKNTVVPAFNRSVGSMQQQLFETVSQRMNAMDVAVKEGVAHVLQTRGLADQIGSAVAVSLQRTLVSSYEEVFKINVLPSFEKSCQEMFKQIDDTFRKGTNEYLTQLHQQHHQSPMQQLSASVHSVHSVLASPQGSPLMTNIQACVNHELKNLMQHTQQMIIEAVSATVQKEVTAAIEQHVSKLDTESKQLAEKKKKEEEIMHYVRNQNYNSAFEVALSTADLQLVVQVCEQISPDDIFDQPTCPLSQPVLLSLIQQLSVDLQDHLDLKIKYLEQSILALDMSSDVTKSHVIAVVTHLTRQLVMIEKSFQSNPASNAIMKNVKKLRILAEHTCRPQ